MSINVINEIRVYEVDGRVLGIEETQPIFNIESNFKGNNKYVVVRFMDKRITVFASDLKKAIENATNA